MKIATLLPSATEIVCLLGLEDDLVGVTHECDYPPSVKGKPVLTGSNISHRGATGAQIDRHIREHLHEGSSIYRLDRDLLEQLKPDLILTQELCDVCAVSYTEVQQTVRVIFPPAQPGAAVPRVMSLEPTTLGEILESIVEVGRVTGREAKAKEAVLDLGQRVKTVAQLGARVSKRPKVYCMEWVDPPWVAGHWLPGMIDLAGGVDGLGTPGERSRVVEWEEIRDYGPEVIVMMPCGYTVEEGLARVRETAFPEWWATLPAVKDRRVSVVNGSAYFNRPGPRIVDGLEILAQLIHPEFDVRRLQPEEAQPVTF